MNRKITRLLNRSLTERQLTTIVRFLCGISLLLIIGLSYSYHTINKDLLYYSERVDHTQRALLNLQKLSAVLYQTTYYGRSYLLLGDSLNKSLIIEKSALIAPIISTLDSTFKDHPPQTKRLRVVQSELDSFRLKTRLFVSDSIFRLEPSQRTSFLEDGSRIIGKINKLTEEMSGVELKLMHNRTQSRDSYKTQVYSFNWVIMAVALVFLVSSFVLLDQEVRRNRLYRIELENKIEDLNRSNSELEQFAYVASHDLQEPLRKIRAFSDRLASKYQSDLAPDAREIIQKIYGSSQRMQALINDLLAFSRLVKRDAAPKTTDLNRVLREVRQQMSESIRENKAIILSSGLPSIEGYESQIVQLFQNLIANSIKYRKPDVAPVIEITYKQVSSSSIPSLKTINPERTFHQFIFSDNGIGFCPEYAEKIFIIFQRLHSRDIYDGTGIGLAICRRVVANHGGYIFAEGEENVGAKLFVYLPLHPNSL